MQLDVARLEDRPDLDREGLTAGVTLVDADTGADAAKGATLVDDGAMRADATMRPNMGFNEGVGCLFVVEALLLERGHFPHPFAYPSYMGRRLGTSSRRD